MNSNDNILAQLRKKLERYRESRETLAHKLIYIQEQLKSANKLVAETEEAVAALEGKTTETRRILEEALQQTSNRPTPLLPASNAPNEQAQPPAEPGFRWENGNLVPTSIPASEDVGVSVPLPPVDENFEPIDPMQFNPLV